MIFKASIINTKGKGEVEKLKNDTPYYLQTALDRAIEEFSNREKILTSQNKKKTRDQSNSEHLYIAKELNILKNISQVQAGLLKYKADAKKMSDSDIENEVHDSGRLGDYLRAVGKPKPDDRVDAHAIVSGNHPESAELRGIMGMLKIRVDDPDNGMWIPRRSQDTPHWAFPKCPPHSRIHRFNYYFWLRSLLLLLDDEVHFRHTLKMVARQLEYGTYPDFVMKKKGEDLPEEDDL